MAAGKIETVQLNEDDVIIIQAANAVHGITLLSIGPETIALDHEQAQQLARHLISVSDSMIRKSE